MTNLFMLYSGAILLGALHAFEPGHGKTLIAAYMVGTKGRAWDGMLLGAIVTITHTFSVILLGVVAQMLSTTYSDQTLHDWLGLVSAGIILIVGIWMLRQRLSGNAGHTHIHLFGKGHSHHHHGHDHHHHTHEPAHSHDHSHATDHTHDHDHSHDHVHDPHTHTHEHHADAHDHDHTHHSHSHDDHSHDHHHDHDAHHHSHAPASKGKPHSKLELLLLGISGGLIPCPAAIATLLAAIAAGKIAQGVSVTLAFSLGLGAVMMTIGVLLSHAGRLTEKISDNMELSRKLGIVSALVIVGIGSYTLFHSVKNILAVS